MLDCLSEKKQPAFFRQVRLILGSIENQLINSQWISKIRIITVFLCQVWYVFRLAKSQILRAIWFQREGLLIEG